MAVEWAGLVTGFDVSKITIDPDVAKNKPYNQEQIQKEDQNITESDCIHIFFFDVVGIIFCITTNTRGPQITEKLTRSENNQEYRNHSLNITVV